MPTRDYEIDEMISAKTIAARIEELSREIKEKFEGTDKLIVVGLLRGSFVFIADLVRELDLPVWYREAALPVSLRAMRP